MCKQLELPEIEKEQSFEDFKRIILNGAINCDDDLLEDED